MVTWGFSSYGGNSATVSTALASNVTAVYCYFLCVCSGEEWGQRGDVGRLQIRWRLDHGIERAGIGRHSGVLYSIRVCSGEEWG